MPRSALSLLIFNHKKLILLAIFLLVSACTSAKLQSSEIQANVQNLASLNQAEILIDLNSKLTTTKLGNQYLFLLFPYGKIQHENLLNSLEEELYTQLSVRGFKPIIAKNSLNVAPKLRITIERAQLSAYDLLVSRKILCKLSLKASYKSRQIVITESYSEFKSYAFTKELQHIFNKTLKRASESLLNELRL